ncbi:MAG: hypothetical protein PF439_08875 [Helicobacteraceae bacterium]|nr:hypothetical protein [Helicobacteraceae bacterium]
MLIYDHNKEFTGIDQETLRLLGYERFDDLIHEHKDVAELFVKKPGYIHNFTNFPWIDFVLHAESEEAKVIIAGKNKAFSATIDIVTLYLNKAPNEDAYLVKLKNIQNYQLDASEKPTPVAAPFKPDTKEFNATPSPSEVLDEPVKEPVLEQAPLDMHEDIFIQEESNPQIIDTAQTSSLNNDNEEFDIFFHGEDEEVDEKLQRIEAEPKIPAEQQSVLDNLREEKTTPMLGSYLSEADKEYLTDLKISDDYEYDPNIAADELGLPVDLIEEFIGDFIKQAHEFKDQLFRAIKDKDFDNIKVLSHKLKGVAANLRIEDAFEVLRNVNESSDIRECEANLKKFYLTVAKLEGKDIEEVKVELEKPVGEDLYDLTPKFQQVQEEEKMQPLDLFELDEEEASAEPIHLERSYDKVSDNSEKEPSNDSIYDFGLIQESGNEPFMIIEDEDDITSGLQELETEKEKEKEKEIETENEEEIVSSIQEIETDEDHNVESAPVLTYDVNTAAAEIGLNADLVSALIDDYIVEANEMKSKLNDVIEASDLMRWKGYATQLKGVSDNLRIKEISDALQNLITSTDENQAKAAMQEFYGFINQL